MAAHQLSWVNKIGPSSRGQHSPGSVLSLHHSQHALCAFHMFKEIQLRKTNKDMQSIPPYPMTNLSIANGTIDSKWPSDHPPTQAQGPSKVTPQTIQTQWWIICQEDIQNKSIPGVSVKTNAKYMKGETGMKKSRKKCRWKPGAPRGSRRWANRSHDCV